MIELKIAVFIGVLIFVYFSLQSCIIAFQMITNRMTGSVTVNLLAAGLGAATAVVSAINIFAK